MRFFLRAHCSYEGRRNLHSYLSSGCNHPGIGGIRSDCLSGSGGIEDGRPIEGSVCRSSTNAVAVSGSGDSAGTTSCWLMSGLLVSIWSFDDVLPSKFSCLAKCFLCCSGAHAVFVVEDDTLLHKT